MTALPVSVLRAVVLALGLVSVTAMGGGSFGYDDLRGKFPADAAVFDGLEILLGFSDAVIADVRIMSKVEDDERNRIWNDVFAGVRLGPYSVCAREKLGGRRPVRVVFLTAYSFLDEKGGVWSFRKSTLSITRRTLWGSKSLPWRPAMACGNGADVLQSA